MHCYKQIKKTWFDKGFNSTSFNLVVARILFTLLVYSFIQIYLNVEKLKELANKTMEFLRVQEYMGTDAVIMHSKGYYATLDTDEALYYVVELEGKPHERFRKWISKFILKKPEH